MTAVLRAIDFRLGTLEGNLVIFKETFIAGASVITETEHRIDELRTLRKYLTEKLGKGKMVSRGKRK